MATIIKSDAVIIYGTAADMLSPAGYPVGSLLVDEATGLEYSVGTDGEWFAREQIVQTSSGKAANSTVNEPATIVHTWTGTGTTNAPASAPDGATGFDSDGAPTGKVYVFNKANLTWRDTTQTVAGFYGV